MGIYSMVITKRGLPSDQVNKFTAETMITGTGGNYQAKRTAQQQKASWGVHQILNPETSKSSNRYVCHS
jgi:hypothetical protein